MATYLGRTQRLMPPVPCHSHAARSYSAAVRQSTVRKLKHTQLTPKHPPNNLGLAAAMASPHANRTAHARTAVAAPGLSSDPRRRTGTRRRVHASASRSGAASATASGAGTVAASATTAGAPQVLAGKTVGVMGGGPGGMLCAAHLARLGASVDVFERFPPVKLAQAGWSISLKDSGRRAIRAAGLNPEFGPEWKYEGAAMYFPNKPPKFIGDWAGRPAPVDLLALATQPGIVARLAAECGRVYGDAVTVTHGMRAVGGRVCEGEVVLEDAAGERTTRQFDLVVGADGVGSAVRDLMQEQDQGMQARVDCSACGIVGTYVDTPGSLSAYATLDTPGGTPFEGTPDGCDDPLQGNVIAFVRPDPESPAGKSLGFFFVNSWQGGKTVAVAINGDAKWLEEERSVEDLVQALEETYPHVPRRWLLQMAEHVHGEVAAKQLRMRSPKFVTCSKIASGRAVLVGDAAHAVSPNVGMGCNAALQDGEVLARSCIAAGGRGGDITDMALQYNVERLENARALVEVSRSVDGIRTFDYHKSWAKAAPGLPYLIMSTMSEVPATAPVPGFLRPDFVMMTMFDTTDRWKAIREKTWLYCARLALVSFVTVALLSTAVWKGASMLPGA